MLNLLNFRETGLHPPLILNRAEATRRAFSLDVSKHVDIEKVLDSGINTLDVDPVEDRYLLCGGADGTISVHDLHNMKGVPACTYPNICKVGRGHKGRHKYSIETVQWYPLDTGMFVSSGMDKTLKVWDTNSLKPADEFEFSGVVYSHDMSLCATTHSLIAAATQSSKLRLIDIKSGSATHTLKGHRRPVLVAKWSSREEFILASGSEDSKVMLWDIRSAKGCLAVLDQYNGDNMADANSVNTAHDGRVNGMCFTADGMHLLTFGTDNELRLWSTLTGKNLLVNYGKAENEWQKKIQFSVSDHTSPDLVFVPCASNIEVYDIFTGIPLCTLRGHYNQVNCCLFNSTHHEMYSGGNDQNVLCWTPMTECVRQYEEGLLQSKDEQHPEKPTVRFTSRVGVADAWSSSDED